MNDAVGFGSDQMAASRDVHRVMFFPAGNPPPPEMSEDNTLVVLVKELMHPAWHMITRNIGLGDDLCERSLLDALIEIGDFKSESDLIK